MWKNKIFEVWGGENIPKELRIEKDAESYLFGNRIIFDNPDRFCTNHGLDEQLKDFGDYKLGLIYYYRPSDNSIQEIVAER